MTSPSSNVDAALRKYSRGYALLNRSHRPATAFQQPLDFMQATGASTPKPTKARPSLDWSIDTALHQDDESLTESRRVDHSMVLDSRQGPSVREVRRGGPRPGGDVLNAYGPFNTQPSHHYSNKECTARRDAKDRVAQPYMHGTSMRPQHGQFQPNLASRRDDDRIIETRGSQSDLHCLQTSQLAQTHELRGRELDDFVDVPML